MVKELEDIYGFNNDSYSSTRIYAFLLKDSCLTGFVNIQNVLNGQ